RADLIKVLAKMYPHDSFEDNLTSETSILIVHSGRDKWSQSRKYQHAISSRPDIRLVSYETVLNTYNSWLQGDEVGLRPEKLKIMPIFDNVSVSISRLDAELIGKIKDMVESNGGSVVESISTVSDVLVTTVPEGLRYSKAREWGVPVVSPDWVYDSVERGGMLSVMEYFLTGENSKGRRDDACDWEKVRAWKQAEQGKLQTEKAKRSVDTHEKERDLKVRKVDRTNKVWKSIMGNIKVSNLKRGLEDNWSQEQEEEESLSQASVLDASQVSTESTLFEGVSFALGAGYTEAQKNILKKVITSHRGKIQDNADYTVVSSTLDSIPAGASDNVITELALERSIYYKTLDFDSMWSRPFVPRPESETALFEGVPKRVVSITGFKGVELSHLEKHLAKLRTCRLSSVFSRSTGLLIFNDELPKAELLTNQKLVLAAKWRTKCISIGEFWDVFR
ncbi:hypothetical protein KL943_005123, partial [Ogataea angusta]